MDPLLRSQSPGGCCGFGQFSLRLDTRRSRCQLMLVLASSASFFGTITYIREAPFFLMQRSHFHERALY
jgi:hypothetical protein